jgi:Tfp pilus assembly protein PilO
MVDILKGTPLPQDWMALGGILSAAAAVGAAFFFLVYQVQLEEIGRIEAEDRIVMANLKKAQQIEREIEKLREETEEILLLVTSFEQRLPSSRELVQMQTDIEDMAIAVDVKMKVDPRPPIIDASKETILYSVEATGTYHKVATFINLLERYVRYLKVSDLKLKSEKGETSAVFTLYTYTFIEDKTGGV